MGQAMKLCQGRLCSATLDQIGSIALYASGSGYFKRSERSIKSAATPLWQSSQRSRVSFQVPEGRLLCDGRLPVDDADKFQIWLLETFEDNGETVMFAPGEGFYGTPGKGRNEIRIAYVLKQADLERAMDLLASVSKHTMQRNENKAAA